MIDKTHTLCMQKLTQAFKFCYLNTLTNISLFTHYHINTMASLTHCNLILFFHIFLLFIISYPPNTLSQDPTSSSPTIAPCTSNLLPLIPCTPFAQGAVSAPASDCCSNLKQLYGQEPHCICLLLNNTAFTSFPINKTLAIQIPSLCNLQVNNSVCPGNKITSFFFY